MADRMAETQGSFLASHGAIQLEWSLVTRKLTPQNAGLDHLLDCALERWREERN